MRWFLALLCCAAAPAADPALLRHVMPEAVIVAGVDLRATRNTALGRFLLDRFGGGGKELKDFVAATGFDPERDLEEIVWSAPASGEGFLLVARGTFPRVKLISLAKTAGAQVEVHGGIEVVSSAKSLTGVPGGRPWTFAFLGPTLGIAGDMGSVVAAAERRRTAAGLPPGVLEKAVSRSAALYPAWFAATSLAPLSSETVGPLSPDMLKTIRRASGGFRFGETAEFNAEVVESTAADAQALADVLRFLSKLAEGGSAADAPPLVTALQGLRVSTEGALVRVGVSLTPAQLEAVLADVTEDQ